MTIFNRFFGSRNEKAEPSNHLPSPASISSIHDIHKRSMVAWTASRLGQLLECDKSTVDSLMLLPFIHQTLEQAENDERLYLIYLANQLINWIHDDYDVYMKVTESKFSGKHLECILKVYEEIKEDICSYLPTKQAKANITQVNEGVHWEIYRDVIFAATQKKLLLISKEDVNLYKLGNLLCQSEIKARPDIPIARNMAKDSLINMGLPQTIVMSQLLIISEAITNILKHATEGRMFIYENSADIYVIVEDTGPGIPLKILPNAALIAGYSTKKSLGQGFTLMMKMAEQVLLSTTNEGTTIILKLKGEGGGTDDTIG